MTPNVTTVPTPRDPRTDPRVGDMLRTRTGGSLIVLLEPGQQLPGREVVDKETGEVKLKIGHAQQPPTPDDLLVWLCATGTACFIKRAQFREWCVEADVLARRLVDA